MSALISSDRWLEEHARLEIDINYLGKTGHIRNSPVLSILDRSTGEIDHKKTKEQWKDRVYFTVCHKGSKCLPSIKNVGISKKQNLREKFPSGRGMFVDVFARVFVRARDYVNEVILDNM